MKTLRNLFLCWTVTAIFIPLAVSSLWAESSFEAKLGEVRGDAQILRSGESAWVPADSGLRINEGDQIKTGAKGFAEIIFANDSRIYVKAQSSLVLDQSLLSEDQTFKIKVTLNYGDLMARVKKLKRDKDSFQIQTPTAVAGVRGTVFYLKVSRPNPNETEGEGVEVSSLDQGAIQSIIKNSVIGLSNLFGIREAYALTSAEIITQIFVDQGEVTFESLITGIFELIKSGQISQTGADGSITTPEDISEEQMQKWRGGYEAAVQSQNQSQEVENFVTQVLEDLGVDDQTNDDRNDNNTDSDGDGFLDTEDAFPFDKCFWLPSHTDERNALRQELLGILEVDALAHLDGVLEQRQDFETGKTLLDRFGNWVRSKEYVFQNGNQVQVVALTQRRDEAGPDAGIGSIILETNFNQSLNGVDLKSLPWSNILAASDVHAIQYVNQPDIYPVDTKLIMQSPMNDTASFGREYSALTPNEAFWYQDVTGRSVNVNGTDFDIDNPLAVDTAFTKDQSYVLSFGVIDNRGDVPQAQFYVAKLYLINDLGEVQSPEGIFPEFGSSADVFDALGLYLGSGTELNLELDLISSNIPDGRHIDNIITPELFVPYLRSPIAQD
ncbi:FecR domain-containing protein [PVC group bacterium]|nr:FecR domain-containing protein [PVC group bacterium]